MYRSDKMSLYIYTDIPELKQMLIDQSQKHRWTDSGFDIPLAYGHALGYNYHNYTMNLHVKVAAMEGNQTRPCLLVPRSSISKSLVRLANSIGLIDQGYRGEVQAKVDTITSDPLVNAHPNKGDRLFQICRHNFLPWEEVFIVSSENELPKAPDNRGEGGFGSTGR